MIEEAVLVIWKDLEERELNGGSAEFPYYERLYLAQAYWQLTDTRQFERWTDREGPRVLAAQKPDGSWSSRFYGDSYATAMNCLFLALPEGLLPIFQR